jgi:Vam6/Vps39-like protein vacuolar protein sorting-associated protein 39
VATPDADTPSVYHILLALYLTPPAPHAVQLEPALELLSNHGARLPASQTLTLIPPELHVKILESYFTGRMRAAASAVNEERVMAGLRAVLAREAEAKLQLEEKAKKVVIGEDILCPVCMRRFGAGSAVRVFPDGRVVHYGCFGRMAKGKIVK